VSAVYPDFLVERDDAWYIDPDDLCVTCCSFDWAVSLLLASAELSFSVRIGQPFLIRREGTVDETWVNPERRPPDAPPVLVLLDLAVERFRIVKDGRLDLAFANDWRVEVPQGPHYEAFEINGPNGLQFVSTPTGGLSVWLDDESPKSVTDDAMRYSGPKRAP
jgi:hypothetical protein